MPDNITVASVQTYKANVELLLQQKESRLAGKVMVQSLVGKAASIVEQFGEATAQLKTGRHADTPLLDISQDKRWVFPSDYEWASLIDHEDKLRMIIDPTSPYAMAGAAAMNRVKDDVILAAMFGTNYIGENGTTQETFGTVDSGAYDVPVATGGSASALNVAKLQLAIRLLMTANKGELMEPVYGAISSYEHDSLLKEIQVVNKDYGNSAVLVDGQVRRFMGIDFTITERLSVNSSGNRLVPVWLKSGMCLGMWNDMQAEVGPRPDKSYATQVYLAMTLGATRTQLGKIIRIGCDDQI
jgi:hypothetical protein